LMTGRKRPGRFREGRAHSAQWVGMTRQWAWSGGLLLAALGMSGSSCGSPGNGYSLPVGTDDRGGGEFADDGASGAGPLDAFIQQGRVTVKFVTIGCAGPCASVKAVASGGHPPYTFAWDNGSTDPSRQVCPTSDASYHVKVSDTGTTGEFARPPETVQVPLTADVIACPDAGIADGGSPSCDPDAAGPTISPPTVEVDPTGSTHYVANGASLPAGRYRAQWVDGCMRWAYGGPAFGWDVNDPPPGVFGGPVSMDPGFCLLVDAQGAFVSALPGLMGTAADSGTMDYPSCIAANQGVAPVDFDFAGGKLGVIANDLAAGDNTTGESAGGVSPTWRITYLSACP
jgi:hypothetical protein